MAVKDIKAALRTLAKDIPDDIDVTNAESGIMNLIDRIRQDVNYHVEKASLRKHVAERNRLREAAHKRELHFQETAVRIAEAVGGTGGDAMLAQKIVMAQFEQGLDVFDETEFAESYKAFTEGRPRRETTIVHTDPEPNGPEPVEAGSADDDLPRREPDSPEPGM
jgi:hypothetical protein